MTIQLPHNAKNHDYEDQICAILHAHGYYLETSLILKNGTEEVLEFDAIATPTNNHKDRKIVEIKSGGWGLSDIFKLYGQASFTNEESAWLIYKKEISDTKRKAIDEVEKKVPVSSININIEDEKNTQEDSEKFPPGLEIDDELANKIFLTSWWSRSGERVAKSKFSSWQKQHKDALPIAETAKQYVQAIDDCLFKQNPLVRVHALYEAYKEAPQLSLNLTKAIASSSKKPYQDIQSAASNTHNHPYLQFIIAQEYRARIAIIKNAHDAINDEEISHKESKIPFTRNGLIHALLPDYFSSSMKKLGEFEYANNIPFFFQIFVEVFGGFYFPEDERELEAISKSTGIPPHKIPQALDIMNSFFPFKKGWIYEGNGITFLKAVPAFLRGAGCFMRTDLYGKGWNEKFPHSKNMTTNWHNSLYKILEPTLKAESKNP